VASRIEWKGAVVEKDARQAAAKGLISVADAVVDVAKSIVHVKTGTCKRSIHTAPPGYSGAGDFEQAKTTDLQAPGMGARFSGLVAQYGVVWIGSWVPYACVLEGRFPYIYPAFERVRGREADARMARAFKMAGF
jgi:hypothetical protein